MFEAAGQMATVAAKPAKNKRLTSSRLRILHLVPRSSRGGIYRVICDLFEVFAGDRGVELRAALITAAGDDNEFVFKGSHVLVAGHAVRKFWVLWKLARQSDLIHLHGFTPWQALICWLARRKMVYTNHGLLGTGRELRPHEHVKLVLLKLFLRHAVHRIIHVSAFMQRRMLDEYRVPAAKCVVVHNSTAWPPQPPHFNPGIRLRLGFHGRFASVKRIDRLLHVAALVSRQRAVEVVLVGEGPLQQELASLAASLGVSLRCERYCLAVEKLISEFDVEIIASQGEPFGLSAVEALQAGHPTFVFADGGGLLEIFADGAEWFICRDEVEMSEKILSLEKVDQCQQALRKLQRLQRRVSSCFSRQVFAAGYRRVYLSKESCKKSEVAS